MLYLTTRDNKDAHTAYKALTHANGPDGGQFVPFRLPEMTHKEIAELKDKTFGEIIAEILNVFFSLHLTGWDIDCCIGRSPVKLSLMNHKILMAESWHNLAGDYQYIVSSLYKLACGTADTKVVPTAWFQIAAHISVLFSVYGEMLKGEHISLDETFDISVPTGDFSAPMAAWYCSKMGLPVNMVICTSKEDSTVWDLIHRGTFNPTAADACLIDGVERLIYSTIGLDAAQSYLSKVEAGRIYSVGEESMKSVSNGFFCTVAGDKRAETVINSVYRTNQYRIDSETALLYGGLQDYRAKSGDSKVTVILAESTPKEN